MAEPKTRCATCGTSILTRTAERNFGLCAPCYGKARSRAPQAFELPSDLLTRIVSMGHDPAHFRDMAWRDGPVAVKQFLDHLDEVAAEYRHRSPALRAFANECRRAAPAPDVRLLAAPDLAQYRILRDKMSAFVESQDGLVTLAPRPHYLAILSTNRVGLAAAEKLFDSSTAVILEESEQSRWFNETYPAPEERLWWYGLAWWRIQVNPGEIETERIDRRTPRSSMDSFWIVESGVQWGPLAGGSRQELWRWDGTQATFVETYRDLTF